MTEQQSRGIWRRWCIHRQSTAEIARELKPLKECDIERVVAGWLDAQYKDRKKGHI